MFLHKTGRFFPLVSFFGIMIFPTLVVFACLLPAMDFIQNSDVNLVTVLGFFVCIGAATLQLVSDIQLHRFRKGRPDHAGIIREGLWRYSRHPNYLGEILMWWGVFLMAASAAPGRLYLSLGALVNTLMFVFISIPMAEKHLASYKPEFEQYKRETSMLVPIKWLRFREERRKA
jgi:steroid 5-alpha reductase family enzyme